MCLFAETRSLVHTDRTNRSRAIQRLLVALNSNIIRAGNVPVADTVEDSITRHQPRHHHYVFIRTSNGLFASVANCAKAFTLSNWLQLPAGFCTARRMLMASFRPPSMLLT